MHRKALSFLFVVLFLLAGCDLLNNLNQTDAPGTPTAATLTPTATNTPVPVVTPDIVVPTAVTETRTTLRVWVPPEIMLATEESSATFMGQINTYGSNHPELNLILEPKAVTGQGGILSYLRTGRQVAPDVMPDLIVITTDQLSSALTGELIYPLDGLVETELLEDLYPAGLDLAFSEERIAGYPFVLSDLPHLVYKNNNEIESPPPEWEDFIESTDQSFIFPATSQAGATLILQFYLAAGGALTNDAGQLELQMTPLVTALQQLNQARGSNFILAQSSNIDTLPESWQLFQTGPATTALTNSNQYLQVRTDELAVSVSPIPGFTQPLTPLARGWAWAISAADENKRQLAADLLTQMIDSRFLGEWSLQARLLPARRDALTFWPETDSYRPFANEQLQIAEAHPFAANSAVMTALSDAVFDVVSLSQSPQIAAEEAITALQP